MSVCFIPPTPHFFIVKLELTGVYIFSYFCSKTYRLWVLVRTALLSKNKTNIKNFHLKMNIFTAVKHCCILHGRVCVMTSGTMPISFLLPSDILDVLPSGYMNGCCKPLNIESNTTQGYTFFSYFCSKI